MFSYKPSEEIKIGDIYKDQYKNNSKKIIDYV